MQQAETVQFAINDSKGEFFRDTDLEAPPGKNIEFTSPALARGTHVGMAYGRNDEEK